MCMRIWQVLLLLLMAATCRADDGFSFHEMDRVILMGEKGGFVFAPPQGYKVEELDPRHHFAILFRLINENISKAVPLSMEQKDVVFRLTILARSKSHPLLIGGHPWLSDGENTALLDEQDHAELQRILGTRNDRDSQVPLAALREIVENYKEQWSGEPNALSREKNTDSTINERFSGTVPNEHPAAHRDDARVDEAGSPSTIHDVDQARHVNSNPALANGPPAKHDRVAEGDLSNASSAVESISASSEAKNATSIKRPVITILISLALAYGIFRRYKNRVGADV